MLRTSIFALSMATFFAPGFAAQKQALKYFKSAKERDEYYETYLANRAIEMPSVNIAIAPRLHNTRVSMQEQEKIVSEIAKQETLNFANDTYAQAHQTMIQERSGILKDKLEKLSLGVAWNTTEVVEKQHQEYKDAAGNVLSVRVFENKFPELLKQREALMNKFMSKHKEACQAQVYTLLCAVPALICVALPFIGNATGKLTYKQQNILVRNLLHSVDMQLLGTLLKMILVVPCIQAYYFAEKYFHLSQELKNLDNALDDASKSPYKDVIYDHCCHPAVWQEVERQQHYVNILSTIQQPQQTALQVN